MQSLLQSACSAMVACVDFALEMKKKKKGMNVNREVKHTSCILSALQRCGHEHCRFQTLWCQCCDICPNPELVQELPPTQNLSIPLCDAQQNALRCDIVPDRLEE